MHHELVITALLSRLRALGSATANNAEDGFVAAGVEMGGFVAAAAVEAAPEGAPAQRILLLPMGQIALRDNRGPFRLDDLAHAEEVISATTSWAGHSDLVVDYDHQTFYAVGPKNGGRAIAAGWIRKLSADAAGVWGEVEWTAAAAAALAAREYRYISPLFLPAADGRVIRLANAGLVNVPAIADLPAVAAAMKETDVNYTKIAAALGLAPEASEDDIVAAIAAMMRPMVDASASLQGLFGLPVTASVDELVAAATLGVPDPAKFVAAADHAAATARLDVLESDRRAGIVAAATKAGKLTPAQGAWAKGYVDKDEAGFVAWLETAPVVVAAGALKDDQVIVSEGLQGEALTAAATDYIAAQAALGITITASGAVRHVLSKGN